MARAVYIFGLLGILIAGSAAAEPIKLRAGWPTSDQDVIYVNSIKPFAEAVNAAQNEVQIELYPNGALGRALPAYAQLLETGVMEMAFIVPALTPGRFPDNEVLELPGLFRDAREATFVYTRLVLAGKLKGYEEFFPIGLYGTTPIGIHARTNVTRLDDLKGKKIRTSNAVEAQLLRALGAAPVLLPAPEIPEAIGRKTIDGASLAGLSILFDFGIDRVTTYHFFPRLGIAPLTFLMKREVFERLPPKGKEAVVKFSGEWFANRFSGPQLEADRALLEKLRADAKRTIVMLSEADLAETQKAYDKFIADWEAKSPRNKELLHSVREEITRYRAGN